jgi:hypothetical protein
VATSIGRSPGLLPFEDLINDERYALIRLIEPSAEAEYASGAHMPRYPHGQQTMGRCEFRDLLAVRSGYGRFREHHRIGPLLDHGRESTFQVGIGTFDLQDLCREPLYPCGLNERAIQGSPAAFIAARKCRVGQNCDALDLRKYLFEQRDLPLGCCGSSVVTPVRLPPGRS